MNMRLTAGLKRISSSQILQAAGIVLILLGLVVIFGWYTHLELLMRVLSNEVPVQYNTALLFIGCGLALTLIGRGQTRWARIPAGLVFFFSLLCLVQYFFNLDFGIDRLFFTPYITSGVQKVGRMAPNTALSFAFASLGIVTISLTSRGRGRRYHFLIVILGSLTTALGMVAFLGYLTGISTAYGWGQQTRMAILTTFGMMLLLGLAVVAWGWQQAQTLNKMLPRWMPLLIFIVGLTVTICLWQAFLSDEGNTLDRTTAQSLKTFQRDVTDGLKNRLLLLQEVTHRLEVTTAAEQSAWQQDVTEELNNFGGITALALTGPDLNNSQVISLGGNKTGQVFDQTTPLPVSEATRTALLASGVQGRNGPLVSPFVGGISSGAARNQGGFIAFIPVVKDGVRSGFLLGIFQNQDFINNILSKNSLSAYRLTITSGGQTIYSQDSQGGPPVSGAVQQGTANLAGIDWQIQFEPGPQVQNGQHSLVSGLSLFGGLLISALLAAITLLAQSSWRRARRVEQTNRELVRSEELYTSLASNLPDSAVLLFDKALTFTLAEGPILGKLGLAKREIQGRYVAEVFRSEVKTRLEAGFRKALEGEPSAFEYNYKQTVFSVQIIPVKNEPERSFTGMVVFQDITERKRNDQLKNEFISTVSHELRTPLTSIQGSLGLVIGGVTGQLGLQTRTMLEIAHNNCSRLVRLINDILDMEKIESGKMVSHKKPVELLPIIEQAIAANRAYAEQYKVTYRLEPTPAVVRVNADTDQIIQVLNNLLSNAAKYSPSGGTVEVGVALRENKVRVSVADQGRGIPEEFQSRIFQKFSQADSSDTRQKGGTGLGLSIVKSLLAQHDGEIAFTSKPEEGTTFFFDLPVFDVEKPQPEVPTPAQPEKTAGSEVRPSILVIESNQEAAGFIQNILENNGFATETARDSQQAKALLARKEFAGLTVNLQEADKDELSLVKALEKTQTIRLLPIVAMSVGPVSNPAAPGLPANSAEKSPVIGSGLEAGKKVHPAHLVSTIQQAASFCGDRPPQRILHVEDDPDVAQVISLLLKDIARVENVTDLAQARFNLNHATYDLVILDLSLPDGSGLDLLASIKNGGQAAVPVIVFSAHECGPEVAAKVETTLIKSRTSNEEITEAVLSVLAS